MDKIILKGNPMEMGIKMGKFFNAKHARFFIKLNKFQKDFGHQSCSIIKDYAPEIMEEIDAVTDIIDVDKENFKALLMCMGCCLTIREGHNVEVRGCTAFSFIHNDMIYYGRDNDLPPYLKKVSKTIHYQPDGRNNFILNSSSFINGEEGINQHGLVVAMTFVRPKRDDVKPGFSSLFLVRYILENCSSVKQGLDCLKHIPIASSCNILLADKLNNMLVAECNQAEINIRYPNDNRNPFVVTVNHFTSDKMAKYDGSNRNVYASKLRYETAYNSLISMKIDEPIDFSKALLRGKYGFMCQYRNSIKFETIWSTVMNVSKGELYIADGDPRYNDFKLQPGFEE